MPSSILNTDIMFPNLSGKSTEQQVFTIMNYLYMLKEQLTYSLSNLGLDNINANSFIEIAGIINQPVILRLDGVDGSLAEINVNLGTVSSQLQDAEGNISSLQQTAASLSAQLEDAEGNISAIYQISESLSTRVEDAEGFQPTPSLRRATSCMCAARTQYTQKPRIASAACVSSCGSVATSFTRLSS